MEENIDSGMSISLEQEIMEDLTAELSISDENFNADILLSKVRSALREVKKARKYPAYYTDSQIDRDMHDYYSNVRNIALYDYNLIGAEGNKSRSENSVSITFQDRNELFGGIVPISTIV